MAFICKLCGSNSHVRSSRYITPTMKESYLICTNLNCSHLFKTFEEYADYKRPSVDILTVEAQYVKRL